MKTLIVGLDGVPRKLLESLIADGVTPELGALVEAGQLYDMAASIPEISSVNWTSFMTGANPGAHGIYGFTDLVPGADPRKIRFPRFADVETTTLWDRLGKRGHRSVVINQPSTYPARPIPGALVAGFVAIDLDRAVFPAKHLGRLEGMKYKVDVDNRAAHGDKPGLLRELRETLEVREKAADYFWSEPWSLFQMVITGTDRLQHFLWDALEEADHQHHGEVIDYYRAVDATVGRVVKRFRSEHPDGVFMALSDHGFCRCRKELRLNAWLEREGYLRYCSDDRSSLACIDAASRAFILDPGRIYFTRPDDGLAGELIEKISQLTFEGEPVIRAVHRREDIYEGGVFDRAPDLVVQALDGFDLKGTMRGDDVFADPVMTGMHNPHAFFLCDRALADGPMADVPRDRIDALEISSLAGYIEALYD